MIHKDLRLRGLIIRTFLRPRNEESFVRTNALLRRYLRWKFPFDLAVSEYLIPREDGSNLRTIVCAPIHQVEQATGVLWLHGGGYAIGTPEQDLPYARDILSIANAVIVIPDYRLSVEEPFPAALDDAYTALLWLKDNADSLGVNKNQLFVAGQSAGGGLTAAVTALARDKGEISVAFQMPLYPMLDDRMNTHSALDNNAPAWDLHSNRICWRMYLRDMFGTDDVSPYAAPARLTDYSRLPPTYTFVGDIEPFYDETLNYVKALQDAGVTAKADVYQGCYHAFDTIGADKKIGKQATRRWIEEFEYAVANYCTGENE